MRNLMINFNIIISNIIRLMLILLVKKYDKMQVRYLKCLECAYVALKMP